MRISSLASNQHINRLLFSLIIILQVSTVSLAQLMQFERVSLETGLSQVSVRSIVQDELGNIWLGTRNGLNRYDGSRMQIFRATEKENDLLENQIQDLLYVNQKVWVLTPNSLSSFDIYSEKFENYLIRDLVAGCTNTGVIWVATKNKLYRLNEELKKFEEQSITLRPNESITVLKSLSSDLLIGTNMGLWRLSGNRTPTLIKDELEIQCLFVDSREHIWIGTNNKGLYKTFNGRELQHYTAERDDISHNFVRCIEEDNSGSIWVGTYRGLDVIRADGSRQHYSHDESQVTSLSHNSIWCLFKDKSDAMWVGTFFGGANVFEPTESLFQYYPANDEQNESLNFRVVGQIIEDQKQNLWISTDGGGLNYFDRHENKFTYYQSSSDKNSLSDNNVKSLYLNEGKDLWIGTYRGGLNKLDLNTGQISQYYPQLDSTDLSKIPEIGVIIPFKDDLLLGTSNGVMKFDLVREQFSRVLPPNIDQQVRNQIWSILFCKDELWIGTETYGLFKYNLEDQSLENYRFSNERSSGLLSNSVYSSFCDPEGNIWIGTSNGLNKYLPETNNFEQYTQDMGYQGNIIYSIEASNTSDLILQTNEGISFFDPALKTFENLTAATGLPLHELSHKGLFRSSDGYLFISGINGMVSFHENKIRNNIPRQKPLITSLIVNNQIISPQSDPDVISQSIQTSPTINLNHQHTSVALAFSDMAFTSSSKQTMEYMLEGFDKNWINAGNRSMVTYTNLNDGTYRFRLRPVKFPELEQVAVLEMRPPFYLSSIAYFLYILVAVAIFFLVYRQKLEQTKLSYKLEAEKEKHDQDEKLHQTKIRFFTNISHEFRTPLTLIAGQIELLLEQHNLKPSVYKRILNVHKNTLRLRNLISELLDFRKQETGHLKLQVEKYNFIELIHEIFLSFTELAKHHNIDYQLLKEFEECELWFDRLQMEKVFYNLLANAFKFTPEGGQIIVQISETEGMISTEIINTGPAISPDLMEKIFDRFYQLENLESKNPHSTGIGLALSKGIVDGHSGEIDVRSNKADQTIFSVKLRKNKFHYTPEQIVTSKQHLPLVINVNENGQVDTKISTKNETILIVEDNAEILDFLKDLLKPFFKIVTATNGEEGLSIIKNNQPDIVISDVLMPKMTGVEMCTKLKSDIVTSHIPVILLTARGSEDHKIEGLETGADDYITKPFNPKMLIARVNNILNNRNMLLEKYQNNPLPNARKVAKSRIDKEFLDKAHSAVMANLDKADYDVKAFSRDMALGRTNLFSKIKGITGQTPNGFINHIKISIAAKRMIQEPDRTISEIANSCGFPNPHYFSRVFKKQFNQSPKDYRKLQDSDLETEDNY
ncbi:MAG: response regulator [Cyclobacteriaceae bacterium]